MPQSAQPHCDRRLESWKEIAVYLKRDVRTVQRWEKREGLPVYRHMHGERGTVYASVFELDAWWDSRGKELPAQGDVLVVEGSGAHTRSEIRTRARRVIAAALVLLVAAASVWIYLHVGSPPVPIRVSDRYAIGARRVFASGTREGATPKRIVFPDGIAFAAVNPISGELYASDGEHPLVHLIDPQRLSVSRSIAAGGAMMDLAVSRDGARLYAPLAAGDVSAIDLPSGKVTRIPAGAAVHGAVALSPDGKRLYVAVPYGGLKCITLASGRVEHIRTTGCPVHVAVNARGDRLYVSYQCGGPGGRSGHDALDVIDTRTNAVLRTAVGPPNVGGVIAISPGNGQLWVSGTDACMNPVYDHAGCPAYPSPIVNVWRLDDMFLLRTAAVPAMPPVNTESVGGITFSPDEGAVVLTGFDTRVLDPQSTMTVERLPLVYSSPGVFSPDGRRVYFPVPTQKTIFAFDVTVDTRPRVTRMQSLWAADGNANDIVSQQHALLEGGVAFAPGKIGQAFSLNGVDSHITVRTTNETSMPQFSLGLWFRQWSPPDPASNSRAASHREVTLVDHMAPNGPNRNGWRLLLTADQRPMFCMGGRTRDGCRPDSPTAIVGAPLAQPDGWHHVMVVRTPRQLSLYADGKLDATRAIDAEYDYGRIDLHFGADASDATRFRGLLDEIELYDRPLTPAEVRLRFETPAVHQ